MSATKFMFEELISDTAKVGKIDEGVLFTAYGQMSDMGLLDNITNGTELKTALVQFTLTGK